MLGPSCIHDYVYEAGGELGDIYEWWVDGKWIVNFNPWKKRHADKLFFRMLREANVPKFRRRVAYQAVRVFGKGSF